MRLCKSHTGWHIPYSKLMKSDLDSLGIGVVLYFKMLKTIGVVFLILSILSIPALMFYIGGNGSSTSIPHLPKVLSLTTMGNLGENNPSCSFTNSLVTDYKSIICSSGVIDEIEAFGEVTGSESCSNSNFRDEVDTTRCYFDNQGNSNLDQTTTTNLMTVFNTDCKGKAHCVLDWSKVTITDGTC